MSQFYIKPLDGLRGIAVLLVILYHFSKLPFIKMDFEIGWVGVQLFFVLSGYLITRILLAEKEQLSFGPYLKKFYWRRSLRIFPIYFLYLFAVVILHRLTNEPADFSYAAPHLFTYTYNFFIFSPEWEITRVYSHLWSLSVEEQFYLIWPLLVFILSTKNLKYFALSLLFIVPIFRLVLGFYVTDVISSTETAGAALYWFTFSHFDAFALGGLITIFSDRYKELALRWRWIVYAAVFFIGMINLVNYTGTMTGYEISSLGFMLPSMENYQHVWSYTLLNFFFAFVILKLVMKGSTFLSNAFIVFIGRISYGMYLYHFMAIIVMEKVFGKPIVNDFITFLICLSIIIIVSYLSYLIVERPLLKLKDKKFVFKRRKILHRIEKTV